MSKCKDCWYGGSDDCPGCVTDKFEHFVAKPKKENEDYTENWEKDDE